MLRPMNSQVPETLSVQEALLPSEIEHALVDARKDMICCFLRACPASECICLIHAMKADAA